MQSAVGLLLPGGAGRDAGDNDGQLHGDRWIREYGELLVHRNGDAVHDHLPGKRHTEQRRRAVRGGSELSGADNPGKLRDGKLHTQQWVILPSWDDDGHLLDTIGAELLFHGDGQ
jgi:hypothetical protein